MLRAVLGTRRTVLKRRGKEHALGDAKSRRDTDTVIPPLVVHRCCSGKLRFMGHDGICGFQEHFGPFVTHESTGVTFLK
jgi:hypothetical protein